MPPEFLAGAPSLLCISSFSITYLHITLPYPLHGYHLVKLNLGHQKLENTEFYMKLTIYYSVHIKQIFHDRLHLEFYNNCLQNYQQNTI